jgi:phage terminase large subunit
MKAPKQIVIEWRKQPRQLLFLAACGLGHVFGGTVRTPPIAHVLLYGGSAGSGKSDGLLMVGMLASLTFPGCKIGYFRRTYPELEKQGGAIPRSHELYGKIAKWHGGQRKWFFPGGSSLQFCHCEKERDVYSYHSAQFDIILIDEATQFTEYQVRYLLSRNRATINGIVPFAALASNPGNVGHGWIKRQFVDPGIYERPFEVEIQPGVYETHCFIPAKLSDNRVLEERDPEYRMRLMRQSETDRRALLDGDWGVFAGQYFGEFRKDRHVIPAEMPPDTWLRFASVDWGYKVPCCILWHAVDPQTNRVITYREYYASEKKSSDVAAKMKALTGDERLVYVKGSVDMWQERGLSRRALEGDDVADDFMRAGIPLEQADNRRVIGWLRMREYLSNELNGVPLWQVTENCTNLIRTLPDMVHGQKNVEDVDEGCEDHAPEALRYALISRPPAKDAKLFVPGQVGKAATSSATEGTTSRRDWLGGADDDDEDEEIDERGRPLRRGYF